MNKPLIVWTAAAAIALALSAPVTVSAATVMTDTVKAALEKTIAEADRTQAGKLSSLYSELVTAQNQDEEWNSKLQALSAENKTTLASLTKQIKQIDAGKLDQLENEAARTRERYAPLLARYTLLNKQLETARSLGQKEISRLLNLQIATLKIPVQIARMTIKAQDDAWKTGKEQAAKSAKKVRSQLDDIEPLHAQIKAKQSAVKTIESGASPVWSAFKKAVKQKDAKNAQSSLSSIVSLTRQVNDEKRNLYNLETKISKILSAAKGQLP
jgi:peptidoglycan hydrolase CwlO-like protein